MFGDPSLMSMFHRHMMMMMGLDPGMDGNPDYEKTNNDVRLEFKFENVDDFYRSALDFDKNLGNKRMFDQFLIGSSSDFTGLTVPDILKYKYGYTPGVEKLDEIKSELLVSGASCFKMKWDSVDGEDMSMDRYYDETPFLQKRVRKHGFLGGKFIKMYVSINELAHVGFDRMLNRTYTAVSLIDHLESIGYRVEVYGISYSINKGRYKDKWASEVYSEVCLKRADEVLNIPLLLTMLSPWCYRYWHFLMFSAHFMTADGMGQTRRQYKKSKLGEIYLESETCLDKNSSIAFINEIKRLYDQTTDEEEIYE